MYPRYRHAVAGTFDLSFTYFVVVGCDASYASPLPSVSVPVRLID